MKTLFLKVEDQKLPADYAALRDYPNYIYFNYVPSVILLLVTGNADPGAIFLLATSALFPQVPAYGFTLWINPLH